MQHRAAQLTTRAPQQEAAHSAGPHQAAEQVSESEQEKTDPRVVVMCGHAVAHCTNCMVTCRGVVPMLSDARVA